MHSCRGNIVSQSRGARRKLERLAAGKTLSGAANKPLQSRSFPKTGRYCRKGFHMIGYQVKNYALSGRGGLGCL